MAVVYLLLALAAGLFLPVQAGVNAQLAHFVGGPVRAALVSFVVGTIALILFVALFARHGSVRAGAAPWWAWVGGLLGAFFVASTTYAAPRVGAAVFIAAVLAGQMLSSVAVDHFGWVGFAQRDLTAGRIAGLVLVAAGVLLIRVF